MCGMDTSVRQLRRRIAPTQFRLSLFVRQCFPLPSLELGERHRLATAPEHLRGILARVLKSRIAKLADTNVDPRIAAGLALFAKAARLQLVAELQQAGDLGRVEMQWQLQFDFFL